MAALKPGPGITRTPPPPRGRIPLTFTLVLPAIAVGVLSGLAAAAFHFGVDHGYALFRAIVAHPGLPLPDWLVAAVLGAALVTFAVFLVRQFTPEARGSGINEVEGFLHDLRPPLRWRRVIPVKLVGGLAVMASGAVLGREGPTVHVGAAFATMVGAVRRLSTEDTNSLVAAGAGAGLAAAFNAPLAGILFVCEELDQRLLGNFAAMQAAGIASVVAVAISNTIFGQGPELLVGTFAVPEPRDLFWLALLGALIGACGVLFNRALLSTLDLFEALNRLSWLATAAAVGAGIGLAVAVYPGAAGGGEGLVARLLAHPGTAGALLVLLATRFVAFLASYGCGAPGGLFAPLLSLGAIIGMLFAFVVASLAPAATAQPGIFVLSAIAALLTATVRAPLTGIALATALTGAYDLILAMIATSVVANVVAQALGGRPIYTELLERDFRRRDQPDAAPAKNGRASASTDDDVA